MYVRLRKTQWPALQCYVNEEPSTVPTLAGISVAPEPR